jgi:hypothetical protein
MALQIDHRRVFSTDMHFKRISRNKEPAKKTPLATKGMIEPEKRLKAKIWLIYQLSRPPLKFGNSAPNYSYKTKILLIYTLDKVLL